ncbi:MAG: PAS domain-containing hybrid sensor histidine kinase/response regulator [Syntrophorhabdaceae bacterium]
MSNTDDPKSPIGPCDEQFTDAQIALKESEEKYRTLVENANDGIIIVQDGIVVYANPMMAQLDGSTVDAIVGTSIMDHVYHTDIQKIADRYRRRKAGEIVPNFYEAVLKRADGRPADSEINVGQISYRGKKAELAIIRDITERKRLEAEVLRSRDNLELRVRERTAELEESRERFRDLVDLLPEGIFEMDTEGRVLYANRRTLEIFQCAPEDFAKGLHLQDIAVESELTRIENDIAEILRDGIIEREYTVHRRSGVEFPVLFRAGKIEHKGKVTGIRGILVDLTESRKAQADKERLEYQLRHSQKMEALGTMAGGIAHDFNNILAAIIGFSEMLLEDLPPGSPYRHDLEKIHRSGLRGRDLIKQMLAFSRKDGQAKKAVRIKDIVEETMNLIRASIPTTVKIELEIQDPSAVLFADPTQIQQVIINLCKNASDAMPGGGTLGIKIIDYSAEIDNIVPGLRKGSYILMSITDSAKGIPPDILERIFEPFFTTKKHGRGTGLGLSLVHGIVTGHDGVITVDSQPGKGTTFHVYLPKTEMETKETARRIQKLKTGTERILFIDDEELILDMARQMLESLGYHVTTAMNSADALDLFKKDPNSFDIVISDQTMPEMTGLQLSSAIKSIKQVPFILLTGFSDAVTTEAVKWSGVDAYFMKPLTKKELSRNVRKLLDKK